MQIRRSDCRRPRHNVELTQGRVQFPASHGYGGTGNVAAYLRGVHICHEGDEPGFPTETALAALSDRVGSEDLELVVTAVLIQRQIGGNLAEVLDNIAETIRERVKLRQEIKTLTAQGRMSGGSS